MLEKPYPCNCCPAGKRFNHNLSGLGKMWELNETDWYGWIEICQVCRKFIGLKSDYTYIKNLILYCPCNVLGKEKALRRTYEALENEE
jgi:hypothetical protein